MRRIALAAGLVAALSQPALAGEGPAEAVRFAPIPQVSMSLPQYWIACDETTGLVLHNNAAPDDVQNEKARCKPAAPGHASLMNFRGKEPGLLFLIFAADPKLTKQDSDALTPEFVTAHQTEFCDKAARLHSVDLDSCDAVSGWVGDSTALVGHATGHRGTARYDMRIVMQTYTGGTMLLVTASSTNRPSKDINAIIGSIVTK